MQNKLTFVILFLLPVGVNACIPIYYAPLTINHAGIYCVMRNLNITNSTSPGIVINSANVSIDFKGHSLRYTGSSESIASGIESYHRSNLELKNGHIKGFMYGVRIQDTDLEKLRTNSSQAMQNIKVTDMSIEHVSFRGVMIQAKNVHITDSKFSNIGGTHFFLDSYAMGIEVSGQNCFIGHNALSEVYPVGTGEGVGISISAYGDGCQVSDNILYNNKTSELGRTFGLWLGYPFVRPMIVSNNTVNNFSYGANKAHVKFINNDFSSSHCGDYYGEPREYYLNRAPCDEENTQSFLGRDDPEYYYKLAMQYLEGLWVDRDKAIAKDYFMKAADLGHEESKRLLKLHF